jgi:5-(aminomethyl)-3-furanmethanol phosphate kinase
MPRNQDTSHVTIVKLGGSLAFTPDCAAWLKVLAAWGGPLILVPGGGPFADGVRAAQAAMGFDDAAAHRMALLAMEQFAVALAAHAKLFTLAASPDELAGALRAGRIPVWLPARMVLGAPEVPQSWDVTSDSLAAWLAGALSARRLLLIKSCNIEVPASAHELAAEKTVDPMFPRFAELSQAEVWLAGPASLEGAARILQRGGMPGTKLAVP